MVIIFLKVRITGEVYFLALCFEVVRNRSPFGRLCLRQYDVSDEKEQTTAVPM